MEGIAHGFRIGFDASDVSLSSTKCNMQSATAHPEEVDKYLHKELSEGRLIGPFPPFAAAGCHISRFGVIPKSSQPNKWRLIIDLSHPKHKSVNDGIPKPLCSMSYITVDACYIRRIIRSGVLAP